jgi:hypothetical protein
LTCDVEEFRAASDSYIYEYPLATMDQSLCMRSYPDATYPDVTAPHIDTPYTVARADVGKEPCVLGIAGKARCRRVP